MIDDPRGFATSAKTSRMRALAELATLVTEAPWMLSRAHLTSFRSDGLTDEDILHAIVLCAYFGHLNRIADAVDVPLDYVVRQEPPHADPRVAAWPSAPRQLVGRTAIEVATRPATANALAQWRTYMFQRDAPLKRRQRTVIARWVATWLGDGGISPPDDLTVNPLDAEIRNLAELITLAPWQITDASFVPLREAGFDDAALFDVCATASTAGVLSRLEVALVALAG